MTDHQPLTEQQLDDIEARANAATAGPWGFYDGDNYADVAADMQVTSPGSYNYREKVARLEDENYWDDQAHDGDDEERAPEQMRANAAFIAHARTDVDALLDEVRRLRAAEAVVATLADRWQEMADHGDTAIGHFVGPAAATLDAEVGERGRTYRKAAVDVRDVLRTGSIPHDLMTSAELGEETHVVTDDSDDPEHADDCPGCEAFSLTGHRYAKEQPAAEGAQR